MDRWVVRTPRRPPDSELPAASPAPAPTTRLPSSRHASSQPPSARHTPSQPPASPPSSSRPPSPRRAKYTIQVQIPRLVHDTPQLQPLQLLPAHDSTAYIEDKMLLGSPGVAADGNPLPANMGYLVGWTDLRGARVTVPAGDVLDYVSPYALEKFEYDEWKQRKREERKAQAELERIAEAKKVALETGQEARLVKKPGRPAGKQKRGPGKTVEVPVDEGAIQEEVRKRAGSQVREGQPSLSTPQKGMKGLASGADDEPAAIYRQLYGDTEIETETSYPATSREESRESSEPPRKKLRSSSPRKEAFGGGLTGMSPTPRARLPLRGPSQSLKSEEASPTVTGFTPIIPPKALQTPKSRGPTSSERTEASIGPKRAAKSKRRKTPGKPRTPKPPNGTTRGQDVEEEEEVEYEVKRLEDMKQITVDGARERYFLVRWKGNWAPEENPTWEPEENIPRKLVRKYLAKNPRLKTEKMEADVWAPRRYSSVTEAFEDRGGEEEEHGRNGVVPDSQDEDDGGEERFQVTEGSGSGGTASHGGKPAHLLHKALGIAFGRYGHSPS